MDKVKPIPEAYHTVTPYIVLDDAGAAIEFYKKAFNAEELARMPMPDGKVMPAELKLGDSVIMMSSEFPEMGSVLKSPKTAGSATSSLMIYTKDTDATFKQATSAGAAEVMAPENMFWGDRYAKVRDPFGHEWQIATHVEDVPPEEMAERAKKAFSG